MLRHDFRVSCQELCSDALYQVGINISQVVFMVPILWQLTFRILRTRTVGSGHDVLYGYDMLGAASVHHHLS